MNDTIQTGHSSYRPRGMLADAVIPEARLGRKAGNPLLDIIHEIEKTAAFLANQHADDIEAKVRALIKQKSNDATIIESLFDDLFTCLELGYGKKQFLQLVDYYTPINQEAAFSYYQRAVEQKYLE